MKPNFICPKCRGFLNVGDQIILVAESKQKSTGLILFSPEIGNYSTSRNPEFKITEGEKHEFFCPLCHKKLAADIHDNLSRIIMIDKDKDEYEILFSKIAGEKSTYKIVGESAEIYGEHHSNYIDFINLSQNK
jgi:uncharacterized protein YbaR (Trm112 family)